MITKAPRHVVVAFVLGVVSLLLSLPLLNANDTYFYHEDDAHHFNRTIEMAQRRDLNPHYFNKPALHFYLRLPVVYASVAYERLRGRMASIKEIRTRDPYGLAGYAFSASHPHVLRATRLVSVIWSCLLPILVFLVLYHLATPVWIATAAGLITALSPEVVRNSYVIGVDTLMALMCLCTSVFALYSLRAFSLQRLTACALLAGLACAAKYNAGPICIVPVMLWWLCDRSTQGAIIALLAPLAGFLIGAPFSLLSFSEFWNGLSYEAWHYAVAGHEGNSAERGLPQVLFYTRWLVSDGIGLCGTLLTLIGMCSLFSRHRRAFILLASFPLAYASLMVLQKTHFTRNMLVVVPYAAIAAGAGVQALYDWIKHPRYRVASMALVISCALYPLWEATSRAVAHGMAMTDSRAQIVAWLSNSRPIQSDVAIAGTLQLPIQTFSLPGVDAFNPAKTSLASLIQSGYSYFVVPTDFEALDAELAEIVQSIPGNPAPQRVPMNPALSILKIKDRNLPVAASRSPHSITFISRDQKLIPLCESFTVESHCWITAKVTQITISEQSNTQSFEIMSPWPDQTVTLADGDGTLVASIKLKTPGVWEAVPVSPRRAHSATPLVLTISDVHSPQSRGLSTDTRRLGVAVR